MAEEAKTSNPKDLETKYTYPGHEKDDAAIKKVEDAVTLAFGGPFQQGLKDSTKDAPIDEEEAKRKLSEAKEKEAQEKLGGSDEVKKELKDDPPPPLGAPVKPQVNASNAPAPAKGEVKKGGGAAAAGKGGKEGAKPAAGAAHTTPAPPQIIALRGSSMSDTELTAYLNAYPDKGGSSVETLSKIKEMSKVAEGFDGKVEEVVASGSGLVSGGVAKLQGFLGKKELKAIFDKNPYEKVEGGLGTLMRVLSTINSVVSIVGNICSKLGTILTIVGLFGMIFPPIGAAVSAVARVLNIVGIVCDVLGLALNGVLVGLNGMVLAKQIAKGGSNEEKAATADMMMTEASSAGGHIISLAMTYGPKFMKGFKNASKNVIGSLFTRFKSAVGKFAAKQVGPVANWAKNIGYKLGFGLEKKAGEGLLKKAWNAPGKALEKIRETSLVKKINNSAIMQGLERKSAAINNSWLVKKADAVDKFAEKAGETAGTALDNAVENKNKDWITRQKDAIVKNDEATKLAQQMNAAQDAGNRESAKIDRDIKKADKEGYKQTMDAVSGDKVDQKKIAAGQASWDKADELKAKKGESVQTSQSQAAMVVEDPAKVRADKEAAKSTAEKVEEARNEEFKKDPKAFQADTKAMESKLHATEEKMKDAALPEAEKVKLEAESHHLKEELNERRLTPLKAAGGEVPETAKDAWKARKEAKESLAEGWGVKSMEAKDESFGKMKEESHEKAVEGVTKTATSEAREEKEKEEQKSSIDKWAEAAPAQPQTAIQVGAMLSGLDDELGLAPSGDEHEPDPKDADETGGVVDTGTDQAQSPAPNGDEAKQEIKQEAKNEEPKKEEVPIPALEYWPSLIDEKKGEFATATKELHRMKQIAHAFHKSQAEAKKKAMEVAEGLGHAGEDAGKKQEAAAAHATETAGTINEAKTSAGAADTATSATAKGQKAQDDGQRQSGGAAQKSPDPGEKPSRWHPIKRIWWYVKKWAADKAAAVFGWIQEKISSLVLRAVCGVSMGDMKAYTAALNNRMKFSGMTGEQATAAAHKAQEEAAKAKTDSKSKADEAFEDAKECDQNMTDAEMFIKGVEATEQDLVAEHARATQFLADLQAAVQAERQKQAEEKAKKEAEAKAAAAASGTPTAAPSVAPAPGKSAANIWKKNDKPQPKLLPPSAVSKVKNAAGYVVTQANLLVDQLTSSKAEQMGRLKTVIEEKKLGTRMAFGKIDAGAGIVVELKKGIAPITTAMDIVSNATPSAAQELKGQAGTVKSNAAAVDQLAIRAHDALNEEFKTTYEAVEHSSKQKTAFDILG